MPDERDALISEIQRLRETNRRWRTVAIGSLFLVFALMIPFITAVNQFVREPLKRIPGLTDDLEKRNQGSK